MILNQRTSTQGPYFEDRILTTGPISSGVTFHKEPTLQLVYLLFVTLLRYIQKAYASEFRMKSEYYS